jgi:hypothetical protein
MPDAHTRQMLEYIAAYSAAPGYKYPAVAQLLLLMLAYCADIPG